LVSIVDNVKKYIEDIISSLEKSVADVADLRKMSDDEKILLDGFKKVKTEGFLRQRLGKTLTFLKQVSIRVEQFRAAIFLLKRGLISLDDQLQLSAAIP